MAAPRIGNDALQMVVNAAAMHPDQRTAARAIGINYGTFKSRLALAHDRGLEPSVAMPPLEPPPEAVPTPQRRAPDSFESAWAVFASEIGMAEDRYSGPCQRQPGTKYLVLSDLHAPFHDAALIADAMTRHADADTLIIAGDIGDGYGWSRFTKYEQVPYERELAAVTLLLQEASARFRRVLVMDGNHDGPRLERQLRERLTPEMIQAVVFMTGGTLSPIHALCQRFANVEVVGHVTPDGRRMGWLYQHGDAVISHAEKFSITPGAAVRKIEEWLADMDQHLALSPWRLLIQAHTHQLSWVPWHADRMLVECGCLCIQHGYQLQAKIGGRPQRRGYVTFEQDATGRTDLNSVRPYWYDAVARRVA